MAELDLPSVFVPLVHREIGDPAKLEDTPPCQAELAPDPEPRGACERRKGLWRAAYEKNRIAVIQPQLAAHIGGCCGAKASRYRAGPLSVAEENIRKSRLPFRLGPRIHLIAKSAASTRRCRNRPHPHLGIGVDQTGEHPKR